MLATVRPAAPTAAELWVDVKMNGGRGAYRRTFAILTQLSESVATPDSLKAAEDHERRLRGARGLTEDGPRNG